MSPPRSRRTPLDPETLRPRGRGGLDRAIEARREDGAAVDGHHGMSSQCGETDLQHVARSAPCVEYDAAASFAVAVDQILDRCVEPGLRQGLGDQSPFPVAIACRGQVLERAAATDSEMRTDRRDAVGAGDIDPYEVAAIGVAVPGVDLHRLARQRVGHITCARGRVRDAIAA